MATKFPKTQHLNFRRDLVKRHKLVPHLDKFLTIEPDDFQFVYEPKKTDDGWHPSGHCTPSVTALYAGALEGIEANKVPLHQRVKRERPASLQKTFMVGHFWHQLLQWACVEIGFATPESIERSGRKGWGDPAGTSVEPVDPEGSYPEHNVVWKPYHWVSGSADIAPCVLPTFGEYLVDFKTMNTRDYKTNGLPDWVAEKYEAQINIYLDVFDMERALIVPIQKDSPHEIKEFEYVRNQPLIDAIYDKWKFVSECLDSGEAPSELDNEAFDLTDLYKGPVAQ